MDDDRRTIASGLTDVLWVAPVRGEPDQVMVANKTTLQIVDTNAGVVLGTPTTLKGSISRMTKGIDAHIVTSDYSAEGKWLYYADAGTIKVKQLKKATGYLTHSRLDKTANTLTMVTAGYYEWGGGYYRPNSLSLEMSDSKNRMIRQWKFSSLDALVEEKVIDDAKLALASRSLFALMPNKLGWALNYDLLNGGPPQNASTLTFRTSLTFSLAVDGL